MLADFGLCKGGIKDDERQGSFCGSPSYLSPEMLTNQESCKKSDIYQIGVVFYELLTGYSPFYNRDKQTMFKQIVNNEVYFPSSISENARSLINVQNFKN